MASVQGVGRIQTATNQSAENTSTLQGKKPGKNNFAQVLGRGLPSSRTSLTDKALIGGLDKASFKGKGKIPFTLVRGGLTKGKGGLDIAKKSGLLPEENALLQRVLTNQKSESPILGELAQEVALELEESLKSENEISQNPTENILAFGEVSSEVTDSLSMNQESSLNNSKADLKDLKSKTTLVKGKSNALQMEITVVDQRSAASERGDQGGFSGNQRGFSEESAVNLSQQSSSGTSGQEGVDAEQDLIGELKTPDGFTYSPAGGGGKIEVPVDRQAVRTFQDHLVRSGNADIVRNMKFILKDNNAGEIKLILKPESLGNVRIQLSMNNNNIVGKIVVDNQSIRDVFMNNMNNLNQILKDNGFDEATLDVFVGGQQGEDSHSAEEALEEWEARKNADSLRVLDEAASLVDEYGSVPEGGLNLVI